MRPRQPLLWCTLAVALAALLGACTTGGDLPSETQAPTSVPLAQLDLGDARPAREPFCDRVDLEAVADLLGGEPATTVRYGSGERATLAPGVVDVAHEFSCDFRLRTRRAHAWVFAAPTDVASARALVAAAREVRGCTQSGALDFGEPGVSLACRAPGRTIYRMAGLFGDAWLTCEVTDRNRGGAATPEFSARAQRWCAGLVLSLT